MTRAATRSLWPATRPADWRRHLENYVNVVGRQGVARLAELDAWYRDELPSAIARRRGTPHVTHDELVRATEWKMARGVWRAPNLILVRDNAPRDVERVSGEALALMPDPRKPIATLATLGGV